MSTPNFATKNANKIFAIGLQHTEDEFMDQDQFEWELEDINMEIQKAFEIKHPHEGVEVIFLNEYDRNSNRSYPARNLCSVNVQKTFGDMWVSVSLVVKAVSGYYQGASIDWEIELEGDMGEADYDALDGLIEDNCEYSEMNKGMIAIQRKNMRSWVESKVDFLIEEVELVLERYTSTYRTVGIFSNGEAIYEKA